MGRLLPVGDDFPLLILAPRMITIDWLRIAPFRAYAKCAYSKVDTSCDRIGLEDSASFHCYRHRIKTA